MLTDFRGEEIRVGALIVYNVKGSTSISSHEGEVVAITHRTVPYGDQRPRPVLQVRPTGRTTQTWRARVGRTREFVTLTNLANIVVVGYRMEAL